MESRRQLKISRLVQKEISDIFQREGPRYFGKAFVTVSGAQVSPDLLLARIYLSVFQSDKPGELIALVQMHAGELRGKLGKRMRSQLRRIPELEFHLDESLDEVFRLEKIFRDINEKKP